MPFHSFLDFYSLLLLLFILSQWFFFSQHNGVVSPSPLLIFFWGYFFGFLIAHECDHLFGSLLTSKLLFWAIILSTYTPPRNHASGIVLCSVDKAVDGDQSCSYIAPLSPLISVGGPPVKNWPGSIIWQCRVDSARSWEHPRDMASTSLWPSTASLLSTPQLLGDRGISPINSSGQTRVSGMEGNYESAAVSTGR